MVSVIDVGGVRRDVSAHEAVSGRRLFEETTARAQIVAQIRDITSDATADAATVELVRSIVANAERLGLVWKLRPATVAPSPISGAPMVVIDGTTVAIRAVSLLGSMSVGTRVMVVLSPPSGCHIIGLAGLAGWRTLTLSSGWSGGARYRLLASPPNAVQLYLRITPGTKTDGTTIFTMPVGFRPTTAGIDIAVAVSSMAGATAQSPHIYIDTSGVATIYGCVNANGINLDSWFTTDNGGL